MQIEYSSKEKKETNSKKDVLEIYVVETKVAKYTIKGLSEGLLDRDLEDEDNEDLLELFNNVSSAHELVFSHALEDVEPTMMVISPQAYGGEEDFPYEIVRDAIEMELLQDDLEELVEDIVDLAHEGGDILH